MTNTLYPNPSLAIGSGGLPAAGVEAPTYTQVTATVAAFGIHLIARKGKLECCIVRMGTCGSANSTTAQFQINGSNVGSSFTYANDATDGLVKVISLDEDVEPGDVLTLNVTAAATNGANLSYTPVISQQYARNP